MLIGQTVLVPSSPGALYFGPWMPRQGDAFTAVLEILRDSGGAYSVQCDVETKNMEAPDSSASTLGTVTGTAVGTTTGLVTGCLELVRYKFRTTATSSNQWVHFRTDAPIWQPN